LHSADEPGTITVMARQYYIPNREDEPLACYANSSAKLRTYPATLGLTLANGFKCEATDSDVNDGFRCERRIWM
jgi:hypothetical protein